MAQLILSKSLSKRIDRSPVLRRIRWGIEAATLSLFWQVCAWLPPDKASAFGRWLLGLIGPSLRKSRHMRRNLSFAFPELDEDQRKVLLREVWGNTGAVLAEYPHLATFCQGDYEARLEIVSHRDLRDYGTGRRQGVFVTAHAGNWELGAAPTVHFGVPLAVVYAPIKNPIIDRMLRRWRAGLGCDLIDRDDSLPRLIKTLNDGGSLGLVADLRVDGGVPLPFFGLDKLTTVVPARLALHHGCDLVPTRVERLGGTRFRVTFYDPIQPDPDLSSEKDQAIQMMGEVNKVFEQWIRERPEQWLCTKRAWPKRIAPPDPMTKTDS
jgi:KDO2-lipid IV(A) lauroyltransferase